MVENLKLVSAEKVSEVLRYDELINTIESVFIEFSSRSESGVVQPVRSVIHVKPSNGFLATMPAYIPSEEILATKLVTFFPKNKDVPTHNAVILMFDTKTGVPKTLLDGEVITAMRTAAASAVATKYLAPVNSKKLAILGSGTQARSHFKALSCVCAFETVSVWNWRRERAEALGAEIGANVCSTVEEAVKDADVIVTVTSSPTPVLQKEWIKQGAHINAVGACRPDWHEVAPELMRSSVVYADSYEGGYKESGDIVLSKEKPFYLGHGKVVDPDRKENLRLRSIREFFLTIRVYNLTMSEAEIYAELGEMILGRKEAKRQETTVFKSLGLGVQDVASAKLVMDKLEN